MTRSWQFTIVTANQWYNLWNDFIVNDPSWGTKQVIPASGVPMNLPDNDFSYHRYTPSTGKGFKIQASNPIVNPGNAGAILLLSYDGNREVSFELLSGSWDSTQCDQSNLNMKSIHIQSNIAGTVFYVIEVE